MTLKIRVPFMQEGPPVLHGTFFFLLSDAATCQPAVVMREPARACVCARSARDSDMTFFPPVMHGVSFLQT